MGMLLACSKQATEINITDNWVRATAEGQDVGAAYMTITSASDNSLVKVESSVTDSVEIHSMSIENVGIIKRTHCFHYVIELIPVDIKIRNPIFF